MFCCGAVVEFPLRTQKAVTLSTMQAEYVAMGDVLREALFVSAVLRFMQSHGDVHSGMVYEDYQGVMQLANIPRKVSVRDVRHHRSRTLVADG